MRQVLVMRGGVSLTIKLMSLGFFTFQIPAAANLKASHFSEKASYIRGGIVWGLIKHQTAPEKSV